MDENTKFWEFVDELSTIKGDNSAEEIDKINTGIRYLYNDIRWYCIKNTSYFQDGEDLCQDILLYVYLNLYKVIEKIKYMTINQRKNYILGIVNHKICDYWRKKGIFVEKENGTREHNGKMGEWESRVVTFTSLEGDDSNYCVENGLYNWSTAKVYHPVESTVISNEMFKTIVKYSWTLNERADNLLINVYSYLFQNVRCAYEYINGRTVGDITGTLFNDIDCEFNIQFSNQEKNNIINSINHKFEKDKIVVIDTTETAAKTVCSRIKKKITLKFRDEFIDEYKDDAVLLK